MIMDVDSKAENKEEMEDTAEAEVVAKVKETIVDKFLAILRSGVVPMIKDSIYQRSVLIIKEVMPIEEPMAEEEDLVVVVNKEEDMISCIIYDIYSISHHR